MAEKFQEAGDCRRPTLALSRYFRIGTSLGDPSHAGAGSRVDPRDQPFESDPPRLFDPAVRFLLLLVLWLQLWSWSGTEGYQLADSVEFMERARTFVHGIEMVDSTAIRPFGFSTVLVPFFYLAKGIGGVVDGRLIVWAITIFQMALGLGVVYSTVRIGSLLAGRRCGLLAGVIAGASPVFLQYSTQPVSGLAAGLLAGFAVETAIRRRDFRGGLKCGLLFAGAFLMAYQSLLIAGVVALLVLLRGGSRRKAAFLGILLGVGVGLLLQAGTDWMVYGRPGASLVNHFVQNAGFILASFLVRIGLRSIAEPIYRFAMALQGQEAVIDPLAPARALMGPFFYVVKLPTMLVWPAIAGLVLGLSRCVARPSWRVWLPAATFLLNVLAMSNKGSKDFRLWLPLLPIVGALCAYGWTWFTPRRAGARFLLDASCATAVLALGLLALAPQGSKRYATYWRAMDWVNGRAQEMLQERIAAGGESSERIRVASAYNWAVYLRERGCVDLVKLPRQLHLWSRYPPEEKQKDFEALAQLDILFCHLPILTSHPDLLAFVAERFEMVAAVHDQTVDLEGLGPILILERRAGRSGERVLYEVTPAPTPLPRSSLWPPAHFVGTGPNGETERLVLLDWRYEVLPPQGLGWITYRWTTPTGISRDYLLLDRITAPDEQGAWQNDHRPAWNLRRPENIWKAGETIEEGYLVVPATEPYVQGGPFRPIGGSYRHGDSIPATLWMAAVDFDPEALERRELVVRARLSPAQPGEDAPIVPGGGHDPRDGPGGSRFTPDGLVRVGTFFLPVPRDARLR